VSDRSVTDSVNAALPPKSLAAAPDIITGSLPAPGTLSRAVRPSVSANMRFEQIVITAVGAVCVFVAALVLVLRMSARRQARVREPGKWEERAWSFGLIEEGEYGGAPGYGRPPDYRPPPLWTDSPDDQVRQRPLHE
jgi:hypothetical protein